jgi:cytochrome bd-type quinol oxidase subunit 1
MVSRPPEIVAVVQRIAVLAVLGGIFLLCAALAWWASFYREIGLADALSCLYARGGTCGFITHVAGEAGRMAYSPSIFWLGAGSLVGGGLLRLGIAVRA